MQNQPNNKYLHIDLFFQNHYFLQDPLYFDLKYFKHFNIFPKIYSNYQKLKSYNNYGLHYKLCLIFQIPL